MSTPARTPTRNDTTIRRRDPSFLDDVQDEFTRFFGEFPFFGRSLPSTLRQPPSGRVPARVDVFEKDGKVIIKADLPGVKKEDVHLTLENGDLVISAESKAESEVKEEDYYRVERSWGTFYRRLPLSDSLDPDHIEAELKDGVLQVTIPRGSRPGPTPRNIPVQ